MNRIAVLKWRYIVFLGSIVLTVIASQLIVQYDLDKQNSDAQLINTAGRQRMLGQRIAKLTLYISNDINQTGKPFQPRMDTLAKTLQTWVRVHQYLIKDNAERQKSSAIASLLEANTPNMNVMVEACTTLWKNPTKSNADSAVKVVVDNDVKFLLLMEKTVGTYQREAEKKLAYLKQVELVLAVFMIVILVVEFVYIFLPLLRRLLVANANLSITNASLVASEEEVRTNLEYISALQRQLEIKEKQYRQLVENSIDLITLFNMQGNYIFVSPSVKNMLGFEPEELVGKFGMDFIHPDDRELLLQEPLTKALKGEKVLNPHFRLRKKDGSYVWIEAYTNPVTDEEGKITGLHTTNRDITERKLIEEKLAVSERYYRLISTNSKDLISLYDVSEDPKRVYVSPSVREILGYEPEEMIGQSAYDFIFREDAEKIRTTIQPESLKGKSVFTQYRAIKKDGTLIWLESVSNPFYDDHNKMTGFQTSSRDITQRKLFESQLIEAKEKAEVAFKRLDKLLGEKNDLIGLLSHDMRAPINQVQGLAGIMALSLDDQQALKDCLDKMNYAINKQLELFQNVLSMLKSDQLSHDAEPRQEIALQKIINTVKRNVDWELKNKSIQLVYDIPGSFNVHVQRSFVQAIQNIISNAVKFSASGQMITITANRTDDITTIHIRDNGLGFEAEKAEKLFERFTDEGRKGTHNEPSTGLGLYLVKRIIENHNGTITAHSEGSGKGSVFTIKLKLS